MLVRTGAAAVTVRAAEPLIAPLVAVTLTGPPAATPVARPVVLTVATAVLAEAQAKVGWGFRATPNWSRAVAMNCAVAPAAMEAVAGATVMEVRTGGAEVTVTEEVPLIA